MIISFQKFRENSRVFVLYASRIISNFYLLILIARNVIINFHKFRANSLFLVHSSIRAKVLWIYFNFDISKKSFRGIFFK